MQWNIKATIVTALLSAPLALAQLTPSAKVDAALAQLDGLARQTLEQTHIPGMAVAVVYQDKVVYLKGFGVREVGKPETIDPDTIFQIASVSKSIASTLVAALVGDGVVGWDDRIADLDPGFKLADPLVTNQVTLRDLFAHRSGLPEFAGDLLEDMGYSREEILHRLRYLEPSSSFRSGYAYTNFGLTEAGVAAAKAAGKTWEDLIAERLYKPLGMTSTSSRVSDYQAAKNRATLHVLVNGQYVAKYQRDPQTESPAGGVSSTVRDLAQWLRLQLGNGKYQGQQIVSAQALGETHRPHMVSSPAGEPSVERSGFYGLGWNVNYDASGRVVLSHSGAFALGAATNVRLVPSEGLGIVVLTNAAPLGAPEALAASFMDLALEGKITLDWLGAFRHAFDLFYQHLLAPSAKYATAPAQVWPALPLEAYVGRYGNDYFGTVEVVANGGGLTLLLGPNKMALPLSHWNRDGFVYQPVGESAGGLAGAMFQVGPDGKVMGLFLESLGQTGHGQFSRNAR